MDFYLMVFIGCLGTAMACLLAMHLFPTYEDGFRQGFEDAEEIYKDWDEASKMHKDWKLGFDQGWEAAVRHYGAALPDDSAVHQS